MKALSVRQPWAWLIVNGYKTVENRSWSTKFRGKFLIHAGRKLDIPLSEYEMLRQDILHDYKIEMPVTLPMGGIVGMAEIVDCVTECEDENDQEWHEEGFYAFILRNAKELPFHLTKGKLQFFDVPDDLYE